MFIAILTLLSALSISGVAIFYSVIGLATIFPGAFWPVVIMGSVLEIGKLVTASWLYRNWQFTRWLLKTYLTIAVIVLSLITSMGIFGFLSKAHLEQNLAEDTVTQRIEIINSKISSEEMYIKRQKESIVRLESTLDRTTDSNTGALDMEIRALKDAESKFKTLLAVETNTVNDLNARLRILDKDVSDVLTANKSFFNEEKAAADLKASQKEERDLINKKISEAQGRIQILKDDYAKDTDKIQDRINNLRQNNVSDNSGVTSEIAKAEENILLAQNRIDGYIVEREPLQGQMLKLEAEVGPVKYIAALAVDFGWTDSVNTSEAVRWVILIIIVVFDPLAVLLLIAANQSLIRRFPVKPPKPQEFIDLEKPDDEDVTLKWNEMMNKADAATRMEQATEQLKEWKDKLETFNQKVPKNTDKPVEIIQETQQDPNDSDWGSGIVVPEKKTEQEIKVADNMTDGFDPTEVEGYMEFNKDYESNQDQTEKFKQREKEEQEALEEYARKAREEEQETYDYMKDKDEPIVNPEWAESLDTGDQKRLKPDFTEVIEPEKAVKPKDVVKNAKPLVMRSIKSEDATPPKPILPNAAEISDDERKKMLDVFHNQNGKFEDITEQELKMERDASNRAQYLADVSLSKEEAEKQPPITESRLKFFQDIIDDILRGDTTFENVPEENRKVIAQIMDPELPNPEILTKGSALKPEGVDGIEKTTAEGLKEKFMIEPKTEERPMTDEELDALLEGFEEDRPKGKTRMVIKDGKKVFVPVESEYVQNEEQSDQTLWNKTKELDIPEPEKNEIILPNLENTDEESIPEIAESIKIESKIPEEKFLKFKKRLTSEEDYHQRLDARINDLITKLESKEIELSDLSNEDQKVIIDILNDNG